jgi:DNA-3-methyladenine glycosylase I
MNKSIIRCGWCGNDELYIKYHDEEWGVPVHDDQKLFEMLCLEGMQAGLSWITILRKRENYRKAFNNFNAKKIIKYDEDKINVLMQNPGIIRNRLKINAIIKNAKAYLDIQKEYGSFDKYIWGFVNGEPVVNKLQSISGAPSKTEMSDIMSKALKKKGFTFVGSTICYAFMQAVGMVNDHITGCFRYKEINLHEK